MLRIFSLVITLWAAGLVAADDNSQKIIGQWEVVKGPAPPGAIIEYLKDGTMKLQATVGGKKLEYSGTYSVSDEKIESEIIYNGRPKTETHEIRRLTKDELHVADVKGQVQECIRVGTTAMKNRAPARTEAVQPRFTPEALELFSQITNAYDLNGQRQASGQFDLEAMRRLYKSDSLAIRQLVEQAAQLKWLHDKNKTQNAEVCRAFEKQINEWPRLIVDRVMETVSTPEDERGDINSAASILEDMLGGEPQEAVNQAWAVACLGNGTANSLKENIRTLAVSKGRSEPAPAYALDVVIDANNSITIINQTKSTLHNCVLFTRVMADRERVLKDAEQEDLVGQFVLPLLGFKKETVQGSRDAARLRYNFHLQDKGVMVYLAALPPGGQVTTGLTSPAYFSVAKGADISLWCDEWAIENQAPRNWDDVRASRTPEAAKPNGKSKRSATPSKRRPRP